MAQSNGDNKNKVDCPLAHLFKQIIKWEDFVAKGKNGISQRMESLSFCTAKYAKPLCHTIYGKIA